MKKAWSEQELKKILKDSDNYRFDNEKLGDAYKFLFENFLKQRKLNKVDKLIDIFNNYFEIEEHNFHSQVLTRDLPKSLKNYLIKKSKEVKNQNNDQELKAQKFIERLEDLDM